MRHHSHSEKVWVMKLEIIQLLANILILIVRTCEDIVTYKVFIKLAMFD